ncbi:MAG: DoxX family protein [Nitrospirota bacterium]|nr:MAG: DoxX family protein [Nitrospirota bacterium]
MLKEILQTDDTTGFMFLRLSLGIVMFFHGASKALGWFGGAGFEQTVEVFKTALGLPSFVVIMIIVVEFGGSIAIILGLLTRIASLGIAVNIGVCAYFNHLQHGFFMNWFGVQAGEGYEYHILVLGICFALIVKGAGAFSVDRIISGKLK